MIWNAFPNCRNVFMTGDDGLSGLTWSLISSNQTLFSNSGSVIDGTGLMTVTLPTTSNLGDEIVIVGYSSGGWKLAQGSLQSSIFGNQQTTVGAGGYIASTLPSDCIHLICVVPNTTWTVVASQGNLTVH